MDGLIYGHDLRSSSIRVVRNDSFGSDGEAGSEGSEIRMFEMGGGRQMSHVRIYRATSIAEQHIAELRSNLPPSIPAGAARGPPAR